jgi:hypothetical protein
VDYNGISAYLLNIFFENYWPILQVTGRGTQKCVYIILLGHICYSLAKNKRKEIDECCSCLDEFQQMSTVASYFMVQSLIEIGRNLNKLLQN